MTLHNIRGAATGMMWHWYYAIPNERQGRQHLLRVPTLIQDSTRTVPPAYIRHNGEERIERFRALVRTAPPVIPHLIRAAYPITRACANRQQVSKWEFSYGTPYNRQRGVCHECFDFWERVEHPPATSTGILRDSIDNWSTGLEDYWYNPNRRY